MKIENASISWLETGLPYSNKFNDVYYSAESELAESEYVFLHANQLGQRWSDEKNRHCFTIAELGFGSGLNFLQTVKLWQNTPKRPDRLHYISFEKYPFKKSQLSRIYERWPGLFEQSKELLREYTDHSRGCHRIRLGTDITLDLYFGDALEQMNTRMLGSCPPIQCWFLDGFTPANNPELWNEEIVQLIARCSDQETTLSSYSVAGKVRTALKNAGFEISKLDGFGRKRHMLFARKLSPQSEEPTPTIREKPWFILPKPQHAGKTAAVIGAGLAGCSTAYSLAQRGWQVTVYDSGNKVADGASGFSKLALRCRLFNTDSYEAEFFLHCYLFAIRQYRKLKREQDIPWNDCGVLQLEKALNKRSPLQQHKLKEIYSEQIVQHLSKAESSTLAGAVLAGATWHFPAGGYMQATSLCQSYLNHPNIELQLGSHTQSISKCEQKWSLQLENCKNKTADIVVIANSHSAVEFEQCQDLPLQVIRGQTTEVKCNEPSSELQVVLSGERTIFPATDGRHLISASYANNADLQSISSDNSNNLRLAATSFEESDCLENTPLTDRVSLRCNSADQLPVVGPMPDLKKMKIHYAALSKNARSKFDSVGHYLPGLYINVAHASNGLASCPLSAEFLASYINGENLPLSQEAINSLNPSRFLIRDLQKQKIKFND
jgi:tRNA 5-methylaminomethyl-2-thiouridine biosynthesis bifunctional protein